MATSRDTIEMIDTILNAGVTQTVMDGHSTTFNLDHLRARRRDLANDDLEEIVAGRARPMIVVARMPYLS